MILPSQKVGGLFVKLLAFDLKISASKFIEMNDNTKPVALPAQSPPHWLDDSAGTEVRVCGWGKINNRPAIYPDLLHCVNVPLVDSDICNSTQVNSHALRKAQSFSIMMVQFSMECSALVNLV